MERLTKRSDFTGLVLIDGRGYGEAYFGAKEDYDRITKALEKLAAYEDAEEQGRLVALDRETGLAIAAGWRAIRTTKRFHGASYVYDPLGEDGGPYEIPYVKAGEILRNIWDKYPLDGEEAEKALEGMNNG